MREIPTVEVTVEIRLVWVDILHGGFGEGGDGVCRVASGSDVSIGDRRIGGAMGK